MDTGPCNGSPTHWWPWKSSMRSVTRRSVRYEKKRYDEAEDRLLGDAAGARCRVRGLHGRSACNLRGGLRSEASRVVHGRTAHPVAQGDAGADRRDEEAWQACRLCI